eukprot:6138952-Prymnesium_polylepis.1
MGYHVLGLTRIFGRDSNRDLLHLLAPIDRCSNPCVDRRVAADGGVADEPVVHAAGGERVRVQHRAPRERALRRAEHRRRRRRAVGRAGGPVGRVARRDGADSARLVVVPRQHGRRALGARR